MTAPQTPLVELKTLCELTNTRERKLLVAKFCRDRLGWAVHPLRGPTSGDDEVRGKAPIRKGWRNHTAQQATDKLLDKDFGNGHDYNLGVVVRRPYVCVDLDSKADKGQSVDEWMKERGELAKVPRERTGGGLHLHFKCSNLPAFMKDGKPYRHALVSKLNEQVSAELYFDGLNLVTAPSIHPSGVTYTWEVVGDIPEVTWEQLMGWFGFELPDKAEPQLAEEGKRGKEKDSEEWWHNYSGDLRTLNLGNLFESVNRLGKHLGEGKFAVQCPWHEKHSDGKTAKAEKNSATIFTACDKTKFPTFHCFHAHCAERGLKEVLDWFEIQTPGIVDKHCTRTWAYAKGRESEDGRPQVPLPGDDRPESEFAMEAGKILGRKDVWFLKMDDVVVVRLKKFSERVTHLGFCKLEPAEVRTAIENYVQTGVLRGKAGKEFFVPKSMDMTMAKTLISARQFKELLPEVVRILDVQLPIRYNGEIVLPKKGYDERFHTYCDPNAPQIAQMALAEAKEWLARIHQGFCWRGEQDLVHALARLITPFARGLMGWDARFPLWFFKANRPRAGKDYLAGISMLVYEGFACEDAPLSTKNSEETRKRITSALLSGRRMIHFANCQGYLASQDLEGAVTSKVYGDRVLGGNTEVKLPNELEFSLSANLGLSYPEDIEPRLRIIELGYPQEDANSRTFPIPHLHEHVRQNRAKILSAIAALVENWIQKGCPAGPTPFTSFPEWGRTVGGIMVAAELGDPCMPHEHKPGVGGDQLTRAMKELYLICRQARPDDWLKKNEIYALIEQHQPECEALAFFGDVSANSDDRSAKTKLGKNLITFENRELGQIRMERQGSGESGRTDRASFRFVKIDQPGKDQGDKIAESVFRGIKPSSPPSPHGDLGDLGDLSHSVIIKTKTNGEKGVPVHDNA